MKLYFNKSAFLHNRKKLITFAKQRNTNISFMIKEQFLHEFIMRHLSNQKVYSTTSEYGCIDIYSTIGIDVVSCLQDREGISVDVASRMSRKKTALINFGCDEGDLPSLLKINCAHIKMKEIGYETVSIGGGAILWYDFKHFDEIRIGEALITGYSSTKKKMFDNLRNPFTVEFEVFKCFDDKLVLKGGFLRVGGFTNIDIIDNSTQFTIIPNLIGAQGVRSVKLKPDYYTLIKLADKGYFDNVEII